ncbi:MAG: hypothetical protein L0Z48_07955, partial [candidate division Zixibacteria bacterium]|nr:hypothetical protein [candidate division Zixibacteria bacterium]
GQAIHVGGLKSHKDMIEKNEAMSRTPLAESTITHWPQAVNRLFLCLLSSRRRLNYMRIWYGW